MLTRKLPLLIEAASGSHQSDEFWKGESLMFARIVEFIPKPEKKEEFVNKVRNEVLPILKTQKGFLEILPFFPENKAEKVITITLWMEKWDVEKYEREVYPKVEEILKPYLVTPVTFRHYNVETTLCERFVETLRPEAQARRARPEQQGLLRFSFSRRHRSSAVGHCLRVTIWEPTERPALLPNRISCVRDAGWFG